MLASGSQDSTIRLWRIEPYVKKCFANDFHAKVLNDELLDEFEASLGEIIDPTEGGKQISLKNYILTVKGDHIK